MEDGHNNYINIKKHKILNLYTIKTDFFFFLLFNLFIYYNIRRSICSTAITNAHHDNG